MTLVPNEIEETKSKSQRKKSIEGMIQQHKKNMLGIASIVGITMARPVKMDKT